MVTFLAVALATIAPYIIDGDTIVIAREHIRIANIDAPETRHAKCDAELRLGLAAKHRLEILLAAGDIETHLAYPNRPRDRYGRTLATVTVDGEDVGEILISEGLARRWDGRRHPWCDPLKR